MRSFVLMMLMGVALVALGAFAPGRAPGSILTADAQALATATETTAATSAASTVPASAPTLETTPTTEETASATSAATAEATFEATAAAPAEAPAQTITVVGTEFKFEPNQLTLTTGQRVRIVFQNQGTVDHELEVESLKADNVVLDLSNAGTIPDDERDEAMGDALGGEVHAYAAAGSVATVDFTPTTAGTYNFACNLPGHKESGMTGTIIVQP